MIGLLVWTLAQAAVQPGQQPVYAPPNQQPVVAPPNQQPVYAPYAGPYAQPYPGGPGYVPYPVVPSAEQRLEWLDQRHGERYVGSKGKGMLVGGGLTLGFAAVMGLATLACMITAAAAYDSGNFEDARPLRGIAIGLGIATVASVGIGVPLVVVGKQRRRAYRAWLEQQPLVIGVGRLTLRF